jgi:hypothetical protein
MQTRVSKTSFDNTPNLSIAERKRRRRLIHAHLLAAVRAALPFSIELYSSAPQGVIAWQRDGWLYCFQVNSYDEFAWRITNRYVQWLRFSHTLAVGIKPDPNLPEAFYRDWFPEPEHEFELSFVGSELPLVAVPDLVRFVESVCRSRKLEEVYKWPLFSHDSSYPTYAWTKFGGPLVSRQQRTRESKKELARQRTAL